MLIIPIHFDIKNEENLRSEPNDNNWKEKNVLFVQKIVVGGRLSLVRTNFSKSVSSRHAGRPRLTNKSNQRQTQEPHQPSSSLFLLTHSQVV